MVDVYQTDIKTEDTVIANFLIVLLIQLIASKVCKGKAGHLMRIKQKSYNSKVLI